MHDNDNYTVEILQEERNRLCRTALNETVELSRVVGGESDKYRRSFMSDEIQTPRQQYDATLKYGVDQGLPTTTY